MIKKIAISVFAASLLFSGSVVFGQDEGTSTDVQVEEDTSEVGLLPTNPFYFVKEWGRGLRRAFIFDPVKRAEFELSVADDKATELELVSEENSNDEDAIERASENYEQAIERLRIRLENIQETSENPNVDTLVQRLTERVARHEELIDGLMVRHQEFQSLREKLSEVNNRFGELVRPVIEHLDDPERFRERLENLKSVDGDEARERILQTIESVGEEGISGDLLERINTIRRDRITVSDDVLNRIEQVRGRLEQDIDSSGLRQRVENRFREDADRYRENFESVNERLREEIRARTDKNLLPTLMERNEDSTNVDENDSGEDELEDESNDELNDDSDDSDDSEDVSEQEHEEEIEVDD